MEVIEVAVCSEAEGGLFLEFVDAAVAEASTARGGADAIAHLFHGGHVGRSDEIRLIALFEGVAAGILAMRFVPLPYRYVQIDLVFVEPGFRRLGIAGHLLEAAVSHASEMGVDSIESVVLPGDIAMKRLFEGHGMKARALVMKGHLGSS